MTLFFTILLSLISFSVLVWLLVKGFNYVVQKRISAYARQTIISDLRAIRAQLNPHFIFNSLNSINRYILKNESEKASDYLGRFARLMRLVLDNSNHERISLATELETMQLYIELEQMRFEQSFQYEVKLAENINASLILVQPLIFQPFLENAIWHGLMHKPSGDKKLILRIWFDSGNLICEIDDNGVGRQVKENKNSLGFKKKSHGIKLVQERLKLMDTQAEVKFIDKLNEDNTSAGTTVIMKFKKVEEFSL